MRLTILHVDMDAFYAAVEVLDHPQWRGLPVVVGAPPDRRGVVATCSYEARRYGIHSAMPSRTAGKLCPRAVFVLPRMERYAEMSAKIMAILDGFTPLVEPLSLDEAFMDVAGVLGRWESAPALAAGVKNRIRSETGLTASIGVAPNKFLAKLASDMNKPDGLTVAPATEAGIEEFLAPLPVARMWGVGKVTGARLEREGIRTIGQLQRLDRSALERLFGRAGAADIFELARGRDSRPVVVDWEEKSISAEHTFALDEPDPARVRQRLIALAEEVGARLRRAGKRSRTAHVKLRFGDFTTITRQKSFARALDGDRDLIACALALAAPELKARPIRLVGFGVSGLADPAALAPEQTELFGQQPGGEREGRNRRLDRAVDALRRSFGSGVLKRGGAGRQAGPGDSG